MALRSLAAALALAGAVATPLVGQVVGPSTGGAVAFEHERRMLGHHKRVLMIAAHPDDENTEVLTILSRGHGAETAYLSLTRGEGGQNLIGQELGVGLGLIRSGELLAARALDGGRQYFTRATDYGFSKSMEEAWRNWPRDSILKDAVRIIRRFQPQVIISVFSGTPLDGHGHHQAAGWIAAEAFRVAGDPLVFPELEREEGLHAHTPLKLYRSSRFEPGAALAELDGGQLDRVVGQSFRQVAMRSRSLHRSQNMGALQEIGPSTARLQLVEDRTGAGAEFWAGIDTRERLGDPDQALRRARVAAMSASLIFDAIVSDDRIVAGQSVTLQLSAWNAGDEGVAVAPRLREDLRTWVQASDCLDRPITVPPGEVVRCPVELRVPAGARLSVPYFLERAAAAAVYTWGGSHEEWGEPFEPASLEAWYEFGGAAGRAHRVPVVATYRFRDQVVGEVRRPVHVVPRVDVRLEPGAGVWATEGGSHELTVTLSHGAPDTTIGTVRLEVPVGWSVSPPMPFRLSREEENARHTFTVRPAADARPGAYQVRAIARTATGEEFSLGLETVDYAHLTARLLPRPAAMTVQLAELRLPRVARIGYVRGASDRVPEVLREVGLPLDVLDRATLVRGDFSAWDVIVIGSRAFETDTALVEQSARLREWVARGGRLVVQYQQHAYFNGGHPPVPMSLAQRGHDRVTDETAAIRVLRPDRPPFSGPHTITDADWDGWVQERGLYFATTWDPAWQPFLETSDPGEPPLAGGLLATRIGAGTYIYTGLSFFRQLPAAVPGALRLFLNLLEYEHPASNP
jgi:LmbE family N-acetylglucosaminyl deacetylase